MKDLEEKVVVLTGATGGVGAATAKLYAKYGARLVLADLNIDTLRTLKAELPLSGQQVTIVETDISDEKAIENLVNKTLDAFGRIDVWVNNAGFAGSKKCLIEDYDLDMARKVFDINALGTFMCMQKVLPVMRAQESGVIVNVASVCADRATPYQSIYAASKAAGVAMTKSAAWEYGQYGIRAIAVGPSAIDTPMIDAFANGDPEAVKKMRAASNPLGRIAEPIEIANLIAFLSSDMASFMTGSNILIDGGNRK